MKTLEDVLEEIRPVPDADFVADMERRMQLGFPADRRTRRLPGWFGITRVRPRAAVALAASALLALLVAVSLTDGPGDSADRPVAQTLLEASGTADEALRSAEPAVPGTVLPQPIPPPGGDGLAPGADVRRVERSAQLTLAADPDDFDSLADAVFRTADRRDGFVLRSSFTQGENGFSGGFFELRVPAPELQPALNELSRLATVRARSESGTDVTGSFVSVRARLRSALAERKSLLRRLELATTETAARAIRRRLASVERKVTSLRAQFRDVRARTEYATVLVELVDKDAGAATGETDEALDDAVGSLEDILNFAIRALGVILPLALGGLIVWFVTARARRRARDRALA